MESITCAICDQDQTVLLFASRGFNIVKCRKCGLSYVNPRCFNVETDDYFEGPYLSAVQDGDALSADIEPVYSEILGNLSTYLRPGRLLDVGCAMGHFMALARTAGWQVHGVDVRVLRPSMGENAGACRSSRSATSAAPNFQKTTLTRAY
jgi:hypothetical protein